MQRPLLFLLPLLLYTASCSQSNSSSKNSDDLQIKATLKDFYTRYIIETEKATEDWSKIEALKKKYCTSSYLKKLAADEDIDADPFLNAQDVDKNWLNTLTITKDTGNKPNIYKVCFVFEYNQELHCIHVAMVKEGNSWKINSAN